jgi:N-acetylmuramoyl-L-alanine amidase
MRNNVHAARPMHSCLPEDVFLLMRKLFPAIPIQMTKRPILPAFLLVLVLALIGRASSAGTVPLTDICKRYDLAGPFQKGSNVWLRGTNFFVVFETDSRKLMFDGRLIWMNAPMTKSTGDFALSQPDAAAVGVLLRPSQPLAAAGCSTVVLDPGHGGKDTGAIGSNGICEKKINLDIARRVAKRLKSSDLILRLTRKRDSTLTLDDRTTRAKEWGADMFVSIHLNSAKNTNASGVEVYTLPATGYPSTSGESPTNACPGNIYDSTSLLLASSIQTQMMARVDGAINRGIKHARFDVLAAAPCPAVLIECGFVSNVADMEKLRHEEYLDSVADGIAQGILAYVNAAKSAHTQK